MRDAAIRWHPQNLPDPAESMPAHRVLVTCPPMLGMLGDFVASAQELGLELVPAEVTQTLSESELIELLPNFDGWIIGDDPATQKVFEAGQRGLLKAAVKWGIGVDNVDFKACEALGIPIINTPGMFGGEVADVAVGYVIALARHTFEIDRGVRESNWPKPRGLSAGAQLPWLAMATLAETRHVGSSLPHDGDRLRPVCTTQ